MDKIHDGRADISEVVDEASLKCDNSVYCTATAVIMYLKTCFHVTNSISGVDRR